MIKIIVAGSEQEFDQKAAQIILKQIIAKPNSTIGFATGNTTIGLHKELSALTKGLNIDWSEIKTVNLDEFIEADETNPLSVYYRMFEQLLDNTNVKKDNVLIPPSNIEEAKRACKDYYLAIQAMGGVDLQVLGVGTNGHIAMNEPGVSWAQDMIIVDIAEQTRNDKANLWGGIEKMPKQGITMGMRSIMQAKTQLLMAKGLDKAKAVRDALKGEISTNVPASALQLHPDVIVLLDDAASSMIW